MFASRNNRNELRNGNRLFPRAETKIEHAPVSLSVISFTRLCKLPFVDTFFPSPVYWVQGTCTIPDNNYDFDCDEPLCVFLDPNSSSSSPLLGSGSIPILFAFHVARKWRLRLLKSFDVTARAVSVGASVSTKRKPWRVDIKKKNYDQCFNEMQSRKEWTEEW